MLGKPPHELNGCYRVSFQKNGSLAKLRNVSTQSSRLSCTKKNNLRKEAFKQLRLRGCISAQKVLVVFLTIAKRVYYLEIWQIFYKKKKRAAFKGKGDSESRIPQKHCGEIMVYQCVPFTSHDIPMNFKENHRINRNSFKITIL